MPTQDQLLESFSQFLTANTKSQYDMDHKLRYWETFRRTVSLIRDGMRVVELGGISPITRYCSEVLGLETTTYGEDLRYPIDLPSDTYDLILLLEVVEHLKDRASLGYVIGEIATFTFSGAQSAAAEAHRMMRRGGHAVVSTPNLGSLDTIGKVLHHKHPFQYHPHVREYTIEDVRNLFEGVGFETTVVDTVDVWNPLPFIDRDQIMALLAANQLSTELRGDNAFFVFTKS